MVSGNRFEVSPDLDMPLHFSNCLVVSASKRQSGCLCHCEQLAICQSQIQTSASAASLLGHKVISRENGISNRSLRAPDVAITSGMVA